MKYISIVLFLFPLQLLAHEASPSKPMTKAEVTQFMKDLKQLKKVTTYCKGRDAKIFDTHFHSLETVTTGFTPEQITEILDKSGVYRVLASGAPNKNTLALYDYDRTRFVPEVMPYTGMPPDKLGWFKKPEIIKMIEDYLKPGGIPFVGIGEVHLQYDEFIDTDGVRQIVKLAVDRGLHIHAHMSATAVKELFAIDPKVNLLWAHAGQNNEDRDPIPVEIDQLMKKYPNLWVEVSFNQHIAPDGIFDPSWKNLLTKYSERMMVGTDPFYLERWQNYPKVVDVIRNWLCELPPAVADNLAWKTAERYLSARSTN